MMLLVGRHVVKQVKRIWRGEEGLPSGWDGASENKKVRQVFGGTMS